MLTDPQSLNPGTGSVSMPRTAVGQQTAKYSNQDETLTIEIQHQVTKAGRIRHTVDVVQTKVVTDPISSQNDSDSLTVRVLIDRPPFGWTEAQTSSLVAGVQAWLTTTAGTGIVAKLYGKES